MKKMTMKDGKKMAGKAYETMHMGKKAVAKAKGAGKKSKMKY